MQVHFIGLGDINMFNLAIALHKKGEIVTGSDERFTDSLTAIMKDHDLSFNEEGWFTAKIHEQLNAVVIGPNVKLDNPELVKAHELNLNVFSYPEFLFEQTKLKTRVVIAGTKNSTTVAAMILHVCNYNDLEVDYAISANGTRLSEENDFVVIEGDSTSVYINGDSHLQFFRPNIALLSDIYFDDSLAQPNFESYAEQYSRFVDSIVKGGSITYNDEDAEVKQRVEASENPIRKFPFSTPIYQEVDGEVFVDTPDGEMPLEISGADNLRSMAGAKWICQQMGIDEVEFYEAMATFS